MGRRVFHPRNVAAVPDTPGSTLTKSNQIKSLFAQMRSQKIDNNSDNEQDSKAQEALTAAALVNSSKISTRTAVHVETLHCITKHCKI